MAPSRGSSAAWEQGAWPDAGEYERVGDVSGGRVWGASSTRFTAQQLETAFGLRKGALNAEG